MPAVLWIWDVRRLSLCSVLVQDLPVKCKYVPTTATCVMAVTGVTRRRAVKECLADNVSVLTMRDSVVAASRERGYIALP